MVVGGQFVLGEKIRHILTEGLDGVFGKPVFVEQMEEREKATKDIEAIQDRRFHSLKKDSVQNILKHPEVFKEGKTMLTAQQLEEANRLAGLKKTKRISPQEAALFLALSKKLGAKQLSGPPLNIPKGFPLAQQPKPEAKKAQGQASVNAPAQAPQVTPQEAALFLALAKKMNQGGQA